MMPSRPPGTFPTMYCLPYEQRHDGQNTSSSPMRHLKRTRSLTDFVRIILVFSTSLFAPSRVLCHLQAVQPKAKIRCPYSLTPLVSISHGPLLVPCDLNITFVDRILLARS